MSLKSLIAARIATQGPITLADYMADCLLHPQHGYYATRDPFGSTGDFTTAPEISQMFGELLGLSLAQSWLDQGAPARFTLAELGPGRGTLMADVLRATRRVPGFHAAARVTLIEASALLRHRQAATLHPTQVTWLDHATDLPQAPLFAIANEFFDALPIRQFQRAGAGWREHLVGLQRGALTLGRSDIVSPPDLTHRLHDTTDGQIVETCPQAAPIMAELGQRIAQHGGAALIVDYGDWNGSGDTFQAVQSHQYCDPFADPGAADLTAHVDFAALARAAHPARHAYTTQSAFLTALGIGARAALLARKLVGPALQSHLAATDRLTLPTEMGTLFKVLALFPAHGQPPAGMT